ncbi:transcriptional regulator, partial [Streptomyces sp. NPDC001450]
MQPRAAVRLPRYVFRPHDAALARLVGAAAKGSSQLAVLVGSSSTGKTRACWEAVQALAELGWRLWHPFDPTRADAVLADLARVTPHTVVWLNEAQHYVGAEQGVGERIAAALHDLLTDRARGPVLVLGTLWPEYVTTYTACPAPWQPDPHSRTRELLAGRLIHLPDRFDTAATHAAQSLADDGDQQLAHALAHARNGCLTQFLAGAPELLHRYATASPAACAVLHAAMDARRLGVGLHLPMAFLEHAAQDYLSDEDYHALGENWLEQALADLGQPVHGNLAPLRRVRHRPARRTPGTQATEQPSPPAYLLADYLEQHGHRRRRMLCPPTSFWEAAYHHLTRPGDLNRLARAADTRLRTYWAHHLWHKAAGTGNTHALIELARMRDEAGDRGGAERLLEQAADADDTYALIKLARMREEAGDRGGAERLLEQAADAGDVSALTELARMREETGDQDKAEQLLRQAADANDTYALAELARIQEEAGKRDGAEPRAHEATTNSAYALAELARMRDEAGDRGGAERLLEQAADAGDVSALTELARMREETGDRDEAEQLAHKAATTGSAYALAELARMRRESGDRDGAERLLEQAADAGSVSALAELARMRRESGDRDGAER